MHLVVLVSDPKAPSETFVRRDLDALQAAGWTVEVHGLDEEVIDAGIIEGEASDLIHKFGIGIVFPAPGIKLRALANRHKPMRAERVHRTPRFTHGAAGQPG